MKVQFFLLLTGILVVAQSYGAAVANIKLGTEMNSFLDAKGNYHIVFVASVDDCPWSYTWIRQENCNSNKGKAKYIDNRVAVAAVKYAVDQNNYVALEALAPKFDEEVD